MDIRTRRVIAILFLLSCFLGFSHAGLFWASSSAGDHDFKSGAALSSVAVTSREMAESALQESEGEVDEYDEYDDDVYEPIFPLREVDYFGFIAAILALLLAAGGGIGGGGLLVPIFLLIMHFPVKHAVSLSNVTVFGGALGNAVINFRKRHPVASRPLIDWNLLVMMEPLTMVGALIGADLNEILPDVVVVIMLVILLGYTALRTLEKANELHAAETEAMNSEESKPLAVAISSNEACPTGSYGGTTTTETPTKSTSELLVGKILAEESHTNWKLVSKVTVLFVAVILLNLIKGSGDSLEWMPFEEVRCGSAAFYALEVISVLMILCFVIHIRNGLIAETKFKHAIGYPYLQSDILWDDSNTLRYSAICSVAGVFAGLFGIGGGIVKSPLMLHMGVHPAVASATSATMILFTSVTACSSFMVYGELDYEYGAAFLVVGFVSTVVGQLMMQSIVSHFHDRASYIAYCVALVVGASAVAMTWSSILAISEGTNGGSRDAEGGMCSSLHQHG